MRPWDRLVQRLAAQGGVGTPADARACNVPESTWHRRTTAEGYAHPYRGVKVAPWAPVGPRTHLRAQLAATGNRAVAAGTTALWLLGLRDAPRTFSLVVAAHVASPSGTGPRPAVRRVRWLEEQRDVRLDDGIRCLSPDVLPVSLLATARGAVRGAIIDLGQAGHSTIDRMFARLATIGPVEHRRLLEDVLLDLGASRPESWFHDVVLTDLRARGYPVSPEPLRIDTPDGRGVVLDIPMVPFRLAVEPEGDRFHAGAAPRRADRRRRGQVAGTSWVTVPVDWRDWHTSQDWVRQTIDAAILRRFRTGVGTRPDLPPHLRPVADLAG